MEHPRATASDPRYPGFPPEVPPRVPPEVPPPWQPPRPAPSPPFVPVPEPAPSPSEDWRSSVYGDLMARRTIVLDGPLDVERASLVAAQLLALDGEDDRRREDERSGPRPITLVINSPGGPLEAATAVLDTMDLVADPVDTTCLGQATGTGAVVLAAGTGRRRAGPSSLIRLRLPEVALDGRAGHLAEEAAHLGRLHDALIDRLAAATGQEHRLVARDVDAGRLLTAEDAVAYGLVDEITTRRA
ncbi:MAG TPA: ATP-dependent Clp protease proteolytic subunit [Acidimicrobiales bacterium]